MVIPISISFFCQETSDKDTGSKKKANGKTSVSKTYMYVFTGWEVHVEKNLCPKYWVQPEAACSVMSTYNEHQKC